MFISIINFIKTYFDKIISIMSNIGTFIAALIALFALLEMKKQRKITYKPDIIIPSIFHITFINLMNH